MDYVHIRNIDRYNSGYKDRQHIWAKIYWQIFIEEDYQVLDEIDRHRLIGLIVFEVYRQKPVCLTPVNIALMGWNTKKRPIALTLKMLHKFIEVRNENVPESRVEENRIEESRVDKTPSNNKTNYEEFVLLTASEFSKLISRFGEPQTKEFISRLNNYIASKGKQKEYKSHYHTILNWASKDITPKQPTRRQL